MSYVDGFVLPLPKGKIDAYREIAELAGRVWREHGALQYRECVIDEHDDPMAKSFPSGISAKDGETVVFAWIEYESREHRDEVNAKAMEDPRIAGIDPKSMPFEFERMLHGGFNVLVEA